LPVTLGPLNLAPMNLPIALRRFLLALVVTCAAAFFVSACKTSRVAPGTPDDGSLASVFVTNTTRSAISEAAFLVMRENGFIYKTSAEGSMVYEREGSKWDQVAYGGWFEKIWTRVRIAVDAYQIGVFRVSCKVFRVDGRGDLSMGEERLISPKNAEYYQGLLNQVQARINAAASLPPQPTAPR